jgi:hypothetical protein
MIWSKWVTGNLIEITICIAFFVREYFIKPSLPISITLLSMSPFQTLEFGLR